MERVAINDVEPRTWDEENRNHTRRPLSAALGTTDVALNHYVLDPGERFSGSMHAHADQEEVFLVLEGTATFETPGSEVTVAENEAVRFAPGEFQTGYNDSESRVVALALGAPPDSEEVLIARIPGVGTVTCPGCGLGHGAVAQEDGLVCPDCGAEWDPV